MGKMTGIQVFVLFILVISGYYWYSVYKETIKAKSQQVLEKENTNQMQIIADLSQSFIDNNYTQKQQRDISLQIHIYDSKKAQSNIEVRAH